MAGHGGAMKQMSLAEYVDNFPKYESDAAESGAPVPYLRCVCRSALSRGRSQPNRLLSTLLAGL